MQLNTFSKDVYSIDGFMTSEQCQALIELSEEIGFEEAKVNLDGEQVMFKGIRDNERLLHFDENLALQLWELLKPYHSSDTGDFAQPIGLNEMFRFYKYANNQRFKRHKDGSYYRNEQERSLYTFLIYLNEDFEGGSTSFDHFTIAPKTGSALVFRHDYRHQGDAVTNGVKYVLRTDIMYRMEN